MLENVIKHMLENGELEEHLSSIQPGFCVKFSVLPALSIGEQNYIFDQFITAVIEKKTLEFSGVKDKKGYWRGFVTSKIINETVKEQDRSDVESWLKQHDQLIDCAIGYIVEDWELAEALDDV